MRREPPGSERAMASTLRVNAPRSISAQVGRRSRRIDIDVLSVHRPRLIRGQEEDDLRDLRRGRVCGRAAARLLPQLLVHRAREEASGGAAADMTAAEVAEVI